MSARKIIKLSSVGMMALFAAACASLNPADQTRSNEKDVPPPVQYSAYVNGEQNLIAVCAFIDNGKSGKSHDHMDFSALYHVPENNSASEQAGVLNKAFSAGFPQDTHQAYDQWAEIVSMPERSDAEPAEVNALVIFDGQSFVTKTLGLQTRMAPVDPSGHLRLVSLHAAAEHSGKINRENANKLQALEDKLRNEGLSASAYLVEAEESLEGICNQGNAPKREDLPEGWTHSFTLGTSEELKSALKLLTASALAITTIAHDRLPDRPAEYIVAPKGTLRAANP